MVEPSSPADLGAGLNRRPATRAGAAWPDRPGGEGFTLVVVLVMLAALALGTGASLRGSAGTVRIGRVQLMQAYAQEQARQALAYCQAQLLMPDAARDPVLSEAALVLSDADKPAWRSPTLWASTAKLAELSPASLQEGKHRAQCHVERQRLPGQSPEQSTGLPLYLITARGFSPDAQTHASSGALLSGTSVWLQRVLLIEGGQVRAHTERRLLNPPLP